ncbi:MAG: LytR C-terminal domain-containing protein [Actinomycetes bacterium]
MSTPETPRPGGSHRAGPPAGGASDGPPPLLLPLLSALVVLGAIGLAAWMLMTSGDDEGQQTGNPPTATQPAQPSHTPSPTPSDTGNGQGGGDKDNGDKGGDKGNDKGDGKGDGDKGGGDGGGKNDNGGKNHGPGSTAPVPQLPVYVFNQTTVPGLAAETAAQFEADGWNIVGVDNWVGTVPEDTVYFYPGDRAAADRLSQAFPAVGRVWPASAPMPQGALTVILAEADRK